MWLQGDLGGMGGGVIPLKIIIHNVEVPYKYVIMYSAPPYPREGPSPAS